MKYVIIHSHPEKLVIGQLGRDLLFSTGNLLGLIESDLYSLQQQYIDRYKVRPLALVLWGVADRYGVVPPGVEVLEARNWQDCYEFCRDHRPTDSEYTTEDGVSMKCREWKPIQAKDTLMVAS